MNSSVPRACHLLNTRSSHQHGLTVLHNGTVRRLAGTTTHTFIRRRSTLLTNALPNSLIRRVRNPTGHYILGTGSVTHGGVFRSGHGALRRVNTCAALRVLLGTFYNTTLRRRGKHAPSFGDHHILSLLNGGTPSPRNPLRTSFLQVVSFVTNVASDCTDRVTRRVANHSIRKWGATSRPYRVFLAN